MRGSLFAMSGRVCGENFSVLRSPSLSFFSPPSGSTGGAPSSCRRCSSPASPTRAACDTPPRLRSLAVHTCSERVLGASSQGRRLAQYGRYRFRPPCLCYALLLVCINCIRSPVELVRTAQSGAAKAVKIHLRRALHRRRRRQKGAHRATRRLAPSRHLPLHVHVCLPETVSQVQRSHRDSPAWCWKHTPRTSYPFN